VFSGRELAWILFGLMLLVVLTTVGICLTINRHNQDRKAVTSEETIESAEVPTAAKKPVLISFDTSQLNVSIPNAGAQARRLKQIAAEKAEVQKQNNKE
jgi:hypothetical protein